MHPLMHRLGMLPVLKNAQKRKRKSDRPLTIARPNHHHIYKTLTTKKVLQK
jgi:hypothetical protein